MDISVVIPCYNNEGYIASCVESLLKQSYPRDRYEVIVVDNMSQDRSLEVARGYSGITVLEEPKRGSYAARNTGVRASSGNIVAFTDSDCEVCPDWLERIVGAMADSSTAVLQGGCRFASEAPWLSLLADYESEKARYVFATDDKPLYYAYTNNMAVKREVYDRCGPFNEIIRGGDVVFMSRTVEVYSCGAVRFIPEMEIRHLEICHWYSWHEKMWTYGQSYIRYRQLSHTRPLSFKMRLDILQRTMSRNRYSASQKTMLLLSGITAGLLFEAGRMASSLRQRSR